MDKHILNTGVQNFINENLNTDISSLLLKHSEIEGVDSKLVAEQIQAKLKAKKKLPTWFNTPNIYYPNKLNIEQTSSEKTALYKSNLVNGDTLVDLTGGFGVDSYYFAKVFKQVTHCEINTELSHIARHNFKALNQLNIDSKSIDGMEFLAAIDKVDCIYLDPSRRDQAKKKVFLLQDCTPDIIELHNQLLLKASTVMVKVSPLIDISKAIEDVNQISEIHIVALENQVKEMLLILTREPSDTLIKAVNLKKSIIEEFSFNHKEESLTQANYSAPLLYLYEPNAAILKSGAFNMVSRKHPVYKLHPSTHLYTSDELINFPGRSFKINQIIPYNKQGIKILKNTFTKANISTRNFPQTVERIKIQLKIGDGGSDYLFFCKDADHNKVVLVTEKI